MEYNQWPKIKDLPKNEQEPFREYLRGQTCPHIDGVPLDEQDVYYKHDYERWKNLNL